MMSVNRKDKPYFDIKLFALKNKPLTSVDIDLMTFYGVVCGLKREGYLVLGGEAIQVMTILGMFVLILPNLL